MLGVRSHDGATSAVCTIVRAAALVVWLAASPVLASGYSLGFNGSGSGDVDRVKIRVDDPADALPGGPVDVGAGDFTIEFWMKATAGNNPAPAVSCGANAAWLNGNVVIDRDRFNQDRKFGVSIAGGTIVFGVSGQATGDRTICGTTSVVDGQWHHVAVQRRRSDGFLWLFVDGVLQASADGPDGDVSYPDDGIPGNFCSGPCTNSDPFLVLGAEKHDGGPAFGSFRGNLDELRISDMTRYASSFGRPRAPFIADAATVALYHFDEGSGARANDVSGAPGGPVHGDIRRATLASAPTWSTDTPFDFGALATDATIRRTAVAAGFTNPVDIVFAPGDATRMFVVEQAGRIRIVRDGALLPAPFLDVSSKTTGGGEQGLLGLAFHPDYATNRRFFVYYTRTGDHALVIERYERNVDLPDRADPASARVLLAIPHAGATNHNGGKLAFRSDGYLYIGTGDGGSGNDPWHPPIGNGQNFGTRLGKMLRVDVNVDVAPYYAIPPSNPFAAMTCNGDGAGTCPEIWALGLRNPFRFSFDRHTGDLFIGDVGQGAREEVDYEPLGTPAARNYGWKIREGSICRPGQSDCTLPPNYVPPIVDYDRNSGSSISGGFRYRGSRIPALSAAYLYADFGSGNLWAATSNGAGTWTGQQHLLSASGISSFGEDAAGELYVTNYFNGTIYRLDPADSNGDLLPDWWELTYFGSATGADPSADSDGDGSSNLAEYLAGTDPLNPQSTPASSPFGAPRITSGNALTCNVGSACSFVVGVAGVPTPAVSRSGTLPAGMNFNTTTRTLSGTPSAGSAGNYAITLTASNGTAPNATQTLAIVVAASCGGFSDVAGGDSACNSIEWVRNRGVTLGCIPGQYCPQDGVNRASMALFQHRLALAITPVIGMTQRAESADIDVTPVVCAGASDIVATTYPRNLQAFFAVSIETSGALTAGVTLVSSRNGGATWEPVTVTRMRAETSSAAWRSANGQGVLAVNAGDAVRLGVRLNREAGNANVNAVRCQIAWMAVNRDGVAPPR